MQDLHLDVETYSDQDIFKVGAYKYINSEKFELLMVAFSFDKEPTEIVDVKRGEVLPERVKKALLDPKVRKIAHNANFERQVFKRVGFTVPVEHWFCTMIKAAYCGLPLKLETIGKALDLTDKKKDSAGKALIKYFCSPCKPTKVNGGRTRNLPEHDLEKWEAFKNYCIQDVESEKEIDRLLGIYEIPEQEMLYYQADQDINDLGVKVDLELVDQALKLEAISSEIVMDKMKKLTGLDNPNSTSQLVGWLSKAMKKDITSVAKDAVIQLLDETEDVLVREVLELRQRASKTSTKKYEAMKRMAGIGDRVRGLFQFYGANRTGRWAGRGVQLQNLRKNDIDNLALIRELVREGDFELLSMLFDNVADVLSQLIRTALISEEGKVFAAADFSAIEARVIAWLAGEQWRLDVFSTHGKIYEASASMMFGVPIEQVTKGSDLRGRGKVAELALGFQGSIGALSAMEKQLKIPEDERLTDDEKQEVVDKWRAASPSIKKMWYEFDDLSKKAVKYRRPFVSKYQGIEFDCDGVFLKIKLCSGRKLFYYKPRFCKNKWGRLALKYQGYEEGRWTYVQTYGGKITENIVQATARDLLAQALLKVKSKYGVVMHVHDETVSELDASKAEAQLKDICSIMSEPVSWAKGLPLAVDGYTTNFYKKD
jgi:DNA polymerase